MESCYDRFNKSLGNEEELKVKAWLEATYERPVKKLDKYNVFGDLETDNSIVDVKNYKDISEGYYKVKLTEYKPNKGWLNSWFYTYQNYTGSKELYICYSYKEYLDFVLFKDLVDYVINNFCRVYQDYDYTYLLIKIEDFWDFLKKTESA